MTIPLICPECVNVLDARFVSSGSGEFICPVMGCLGRPFQADEMMVPALVALNSNGWTTEKHCSGHPWSSSNVSFILLDAWATDWMDPDGRYGIIGAAEIFGLKARWSNDGQFMIEYPVLENPESPMDHLMTLFKANVAFTKFAYSLPDIHDQRDEVIRDRMNRTDIEGCVPYDEEMAGWMLIRQSNRQEDK
jgi:hypothetical protein